MNKGNILLIDLPATITIVAELVDLYNYNFWAETIALQAFQPCVDGLQEMRGQPSDDHILQMPPDLRATGLLPEEDASKMDKSEASQIDA